MKKKVKSNLKKEKNVDAEENGFDGVKRKHLLMLVHAPMNYEAGDIIS